jgi:disulfide bond formation protein DsbB
MATTYEPEPAGPGLTWAALLVALGGTAGSLYLSLGMGLQPCPFCYYQRSFIMGVAAVLLMGLLTGASRVAPLSLLALPLGAAGAGIAGFHVYLEKFGALECPASPCGRRPAPRRRAGGALHRDAPGPDRGRRHRLRLHHQRPPSGPAE